MAHPRPLGKDETAEGTGTDVLGGSGSSGLGGTTPAGKKIGRRIVCLSDESNHNYLGVKGRVITSGAGSPTFVVGEGLPVCVEGAFHTCPVPGHGTTTIVAVTTKSFYQGKLILTEGAIAGCGAVIKPPNRKVYVE